MQPEVFAFCTTCKKERLHSLDENGNLVECCLCHHPYDNKQSALTAFGGVTA